MGVADVSMPEFLMPFSSVVEWTVFAGMAGLIAAMAGRNAARQRALQPVRVRRRRG
ncbi:hypothetical protein GOB87_02180 [Acetobacter estunensis]|uniref:Uncharacterized protein n=1 Tax=Acetobacter estunensis TaxID=104097 RepID=A0A967B4N3_9PROT|nr:hypothetical protein [Acetobacter estunensis]NHO52770.1 hypothetical protein [Acetobacter estunensis]